MNLNATRLRDLFLEPTNQYRHLAIVHNMFRKPSPDRHHSSASDVIMENESYYDRIIRRLNRIIEMGFGGVVVNVGYDRYLENEEEWETFVTGVKAAKDLGMRVWIYDEQGYPSGAAGGIVLRDHPEYEAQCLVRMQQEFRGSQINLRPPTGWLYNIRAEVIYDGSDVPVDVTEHVQEDGRLVLDANESGIVRRFDVRRAFEGTHATRNVFRTRRYINVLSEKAVRYFYEVTEGRYFTYLGEDSDAIEAVFTDEPSFMTAYFPEVPAKWQGKIPVQDPAEDEFDRLPMIAWDVKLTDKFVERWGYSLIAELNSLFEGRDDRSRRVRHDFYQLQSEVYAHSFFGVQQELLDEKGVAFSGHVLAEESIIQHIASESNLIADLKCMRIPGMDMLNSIGEEILDTIRMLTCKYVSSAAHVMGREQVMCEASDWEQGNIDEPTDASQRMGALAVQMALGVTTITNYYNWQHVDPADTRRVLDAISRLAVVLRTTTHAAHAAVLYPIRTAWSVYTPTEQVLTPGLVDEPLRSMDGYLLNIGRTLIREGFDFDFVDSRDLIGARCDNGNLCIANESYPLLIIPPGAVMCPKDLEQLKNFVKCGGKVVCFQPCSEFALPEIPNPPTGEDISAGRSVTEVVTELEKSESSRIEQFHLDDNWIEFIREAVPMDISIKLDGSHLVARRSVSDTTDFIVIANGSRDKASVEVDFGPERVMEIWDLTSGSITEQDTGTARIPVDGYSAVVLASERRAVSS